MKMGTVGIKQIEIWTFDKKRLLVRDFEDLLVIEHVHNSRQIFAKRVPSGCPSPGPPSLCFLFCVTGHSRFQWMKSFWTTLRGWFISSVWHRMQLLMTGSSWARTRDILCGRPGFYPFGHHTGAVKMCVSWSFIDEFCHVSSYVYITMSFFFVHF